MKKKVLPSINKFLCQTGEYGMQEARSFHQSGNFSEAEKRYRHKLDGITAIAREAYPLCAGGGSKI